MAEASKKLGELKELIKSIKERVDSMCKDTCGEYGLDFSKEFDIGEDKKDEIKSSEETTEDKKETKEDFFKKYEIKAEESSIKCHSLYDRAKMIFEARNGMNEDGSDYCFEDFVRESVSLRQKIVNESSSCYFGASTITESSDDSFDAYLDEWNKGGRDRTNLEITGRESADELAWKKRMKRILGNGGSSMDLNGDGLVTQKEIKKFTDSATDANGNVSNEVLLKKGAEEMKAGVSNYLSKFMPTSWARGLVNTPGNAVRKAASKIGGTKGGRAASNAYKALGGNKALTLGTLGSLAFGPIGGLVGAGAGKVLQKAIDLGNNG